MTRKAKLVVLAGMFTAILFNAALFFLSLEREAKAEVVSVEGAAYNVALSLQDNLKQLIGKKMYITLNSGKVFAGSIKGVGDHFIHLEKLEGKEYFDALIRVEDISAIDTRFRDMQR